MLVYERMPQIVEPDVREIGSDEHRLNRPGKHILSRWIGAPLSLATRIWIELNNGGPKTMVFSLKDRAFAALAARTLCRCFTRHARHFLWGLSSCLFATSPLNT